MPSDMTSSSNDFESQPPIDSESTLKKANIEYEARIDSLGDLASLFICSVFQCQIDQVSGPYDFGKYALDNFVTHILRQMKLDEDVLYGALMFIQRIRFRAPKFFFPKNHAHKIFISAYVLATKQFAREKPEGDTSRFLEDYTEWSAATQGLFDGNKIQKMERATLKVLQEDRVKELQADTAFDGLLPNFRDIVVRDYEEKWEFSTYPQSLATARPVFMLHESDEDDY